MRDFFKAKTWLITFLIFLIAFGLSFFIVYYEFGSERNVKTAYASATGGTVIISGGYVIHTFTSSGTFTADAPLTVEYLVVAGGGGGCGEGDCSGGGAGGFRTGTLSLAPGSKTVTIGAGGAGGGADGGNGGNSVFDSIISIGGGGGSWSSGHAGGSGGAPNGAGTAGQGNNGGPITAGVRGGGGGGAGTAGKSDGSGGDGLISSISGVSAYYAGGGGAGTTRDANDGFNGVGGLGGGGAGAGWPDGGSPGRTNTGGGGGGSSTFGGSGGSGIVIVRYPAPPLVQQVGDYTIRTFTSSGTFTVDAPLTVEYLVVAGGGGGAYGGGGAGGFRTGTLSLTPGVKTVTIGAGGAGGAGSSDGANGGDSVFDSITAIGGGGTSGLPNSNGHAGGSGGGGHIAGSGGAGTPGQGNNGAGGYGGGGGAGAAGNASSGAGGNGLVSSISGISAYYAGGGGGITLDGRNGGSGGGGSGSIDYYIPTTPTNGAPNTGGGGGFRGGSGGSGVVIIKYIAPTTPTGSWAWGSNFGWVSFSSTNCDTDSNGFIDTDAMVPGCGGNNTTNQVFNYGMSVNPSSGNLSGQVWSNNAGWISFNEANPPDNYAFNTSCKVSGGCSAANNCTACYNPTDNKVYGWAKVLTMGSAGWIKFNDPSWTNGVNVGTVTGNFSGWAWNGDNSGDGLGWLSFNCNNDNSCSTSSYRVTGNVNTPPTANSLKAPNWSFSQARQFGALKAKPGWVFTDPDAGSSESAYQIIVNTANSTTNPLFDSGKCLGYNNPSANCKIDVGVGQFPLGSAMTLNYNTSYYWWIKVWDNHDVASSLTQYNTTPDTDNDDGVALTFTTYKHEMPAANFTWFPVKPSLGEAVKFTDMSKVYLTAAPSTPVNCTGSLCSWLWTVPAGATIDNPATSTPTITFGASGGSTVTLKVTDSDGYYTSTSTSININAGLPKWKEVKPD